MFNAIMLEATRPTAHGSSNMKGALVFLKNGTYLLDGVDGIDISDATDSANVSLRLVGETTQNTIIKAGGIVGTDRILQPFCSLDVENITFDGSSIANVRGIQPSSSGTANKILKVKSCRFTNMKSFDIIIGDNQYGLDISDCRFDNHQIENDQIAIGATNYVQIHHNFFDRRTGTAAGSSITSGGANNADIHDNIIIRTDGNPKFGISMEPFNNYDSIFIHSNLITNGRIEIGGRGSWTFTYRNIFITGNTLVKGGIYVQGPTIGDHTDKIKDVGVGNNQLFDSWEAGIHLEKVGGFCTVTNNIIKGSNKSLVTFTGQEPLIYVESCIDPVIEDNLLYMGVVSPEDPDFSPEGIRYVNLVNPTIRNNRILNRTIANNSYLSIGKHTGSVLISRRNS
jgi:hypothetical protein